MGLALDPQGESVRGYFASATAVPAPGTVILLGAGLLGVWGVGRRTRRAGG